MTKTSAQPLAQPNIASFFAKKPVSEGVMEITPSTLVGGKEKKATTVKEVKILKADKTKSSAEKTSAKVKQDSTEIHVAGDAYCPGKCGCLTFSSINAPHTIGKSKSQNEKASYI
jgi:hypothetical protein